MNNYKVKVKNERESREAQILFFNLGFTKGDFNSDKFPCFVANFNDDECGDFALNSNNGLDEHKEITLDELRAMASTEKEYINKTTGEYRKTADVVSGDQWIEIPVGENVAYKDPDDGSIYFTRLEMGYRDVELLWQRPTQPEALPFVDDEPSLDAEIEKVRQDVITKPNHYNGIECLDAMQKMMTHEQFIGFLRGNVFKYQWRYDKKNGLEDLKKSQWYLDKLMSLL